LTGENPAEPRGGADFQGNDTVFPAYSGSPTGYIADNYNATTGASTISDWLMTPAVTIQNGTPSRSGPAHRQARAFPIACICG
jgi:hypothetical protein